MNDLMCYNDFYCNPLDYEFKEKKLVPDFIHTKELLKLATMDKLSMSINSLKMDIMQTIFVDNDCLKIKIFKQYSSDLIWDIEGKLWECSDLFIDILKEKELYLNDALRFHFPQKVNETIIPKRFQNRLDNFNKIFRNSEKEFFVFDAIRSPDPILVMQLNKNPDRNFLLGVWE